MKHVSQSLRSWWYTTMTPARTPMTTIVQRENMRKRRLFSLNAVHSPGGMPGVYSIARVSSLHLRTRYPCMVFEMGFILLALGLNRQGHLNLASADLLLLLWINYPHGCANDPLSQTRFSSYGPVF